MASKSKKLKASGKFGVGYGTRAKKKFNKVESLQRKKQKSPFHPTGFAKRISPGIWKCSKTGTIFAGHAYHLEKE